MRLVSVGSVGRKFHGNEHPLVDDGYEYDPVVRAWSKESSAI
jgi:hypothetical protein